MMKIAITQDSMPSRQARSVAESLNGAQLTIKLLEQQGITHIAGIPGGANLPLYDALVDSPIIHILTRHEQGAGFIAQGMARVSGKPQVCFASSGPGATNLITAVADAHMDSIPLIAITGQVSQAMIGTDAFQEVDTFGLMLPITKHNFLVRSAAELLTVIPQAFRIASSGRPGPVSVDIPKDVQLQTIAVDELPTAIPPEILPVPKAQWLETMRAMIVAAKRPLLMIGGGTVQSECQREILEFVEREQIPAVCSFMGLGVLPAAHPLNLGMLGMHGARYTNLILEECDLLIGAGVRFDDRATGKVSTFCPTAKIIHIDIDESELGKIKQPTLAIRADAGHTFSRYLHYAKSAPRPDWLARIAVLKDRFPLVETGPSKQTGNTDNVEFFSPYGLLRLLAETMDNRVTVVTDVGQHQMWAAQVFPLNRPRQWISSGGLGTMGFGLPAAIGAALAQPDQAILCISGDGSIMMNIQELDTAVEHQLNIKIIIMNNQNLGLVRQQQSLFYGGRFKAINNRRQLSFAAVAEAMGARGIDLKTATSPRLALIQALQQSGPCLIDVPINADEKVFPMVPPGAANKDMIMGDIL